MCGIVGIVGVSGRRELVREMASKIARRGPDADGFWFDETNRVYFGHRRLSILDIAGGAQPMTTFDKSLVIVFNGEIYNHAALRNKLEADGCKFTTNHSDTEVLLHGYRRWGADLPAQLNGMWSFVIFDREKKVIFGSRDRFGEKPFYFRLFGKSFLFASEVSALAIKGLPSLEIDPISVKKYFGYGYIPSPRSIYKGVCKLSPGEAFLLDTQNFDFKKFRYWDLKLEPDAKYLERKAKEEVKAEFLHLIDESVRLRIAADVPVGIFLSGGIDSSAIASSAVYIGAADKVRTFSIGFEEQSFDESHYASRVANFLKLAHFNKKFSIDAVKDISAAVVSQLDEPMADSSILPTYLLAKFAAKEVKVALGGDGGDELFAGYDPIKIVNLAARYNEIVPNSVHSAISHMFAALPVSHKNMSFDFKAKRALAGMKVPEGYRIPFWMAPMRCSEISSLLHDEVSIEETYSEAIEVWDRCKDLAPVDRALQFFSTIYLSDNILTKVDRATMMNGIEGRAPFLDINLVNLARKLPWQLKVRNGQTKSIIKDALRGRLPKDILYRKKKGFGVPIGLWFKEGQLEFKNTLLKSNPFFQSYYSEHIQGLADHRLGLWAMWLLDVWKGSLEDESRSN